LTSDPVFPGRLAAPLGLRKTRSQVLPCLTSCRSLSKRRRVNQPSSWSRSMVTPDPVWPGGSTGRWWSMWVSGCMHVPSRGWIGHLGLCKQN